MNKLAGLALAVALLFGCAPSNRAAFAPVAASIEDRTGFAAGRGGMDDDTLRRVRALLAGDFDIDDAVRVALLTNQELQARFAEVGVGRAALVGAVVLENPTAELELKFPSEGGDPIVELAVVQDVVGLITVGRRRRAAGARLQQARQRAVGAAIDLVAEARRAFLRVQAATQVLELRQTVVTAAEAASELAERLFEVGNITRLNLAQERAQLQEARLDRAQAEADVAIAREQLNAVLGLGGADAATWSISSRLAELPEEPLELADLESEAVDASVDLEELRWQIRGAAGDADVAALGWLPELGLGVAAEREPDGEWAIGPLLELSIPIFDRGQGARARTRAELQAARSRYAARAAEIGAAARAAAVQIRTARERAVHIREVLLPLRAEIVEQTLLEYNAMNVGLFGLLAARREQIDAGRRYIEALLDYWLAHTTLLQLRAGRASEIQGGLAGTPATAPAAGGNDH